MTLEFYSQPLRINNKYNTLIYILKYSYNLITNIKFVNYCYLLRIKSNLIVTKRRIGVFALNNDTGLHNIIAEYLRAAYQSIFKQILLYKAFCCYFLLMFSHCCQKGNFVDFANFSPMLIPLRVSFLSFEVSENVF